MAPRGRSLLPVAVAVALQAWHAEALPSIVSGRKVLVQGHQPLHMKGVNWNPIPIGGVHPGGIAWGAHVHLDGDLMKAAGVNVIRTYEPLLEVAVLDVLWERGIQVINTIWANGAVPPSAVGEMVDKVKNHPAILMWSVGNEWNYNRCYRKDAGMAFDECLEKIRETVNVIKAHDNTHPVASVYGELPRPDVISRLANVDVWGVNYYDEISFSDLFDRWVELSPKPLFVGEYGADAYNALTHQYDPGAQAHATSVLTQELVAASTLNGGACLGGIIFELADEWWKDGTGSAHVQDVGGVAPGGGPYPDRTFNEEWWGLVEIDRTPREAFHAFANVQPPTMATCTECLGVMDTQKGSERLHCTMSGCSSVPMRLTRSAIQPHEPTVEKVEVQTAAQRDGANISASP